MNWKGCARKQSWPNLRYYPGICLERLRKPKKNVSENNPVFEIWTHNLLNTPKQSKYAFLSADVSHISPMYNCIQMSWSYVLCNSRLLSTALVCRGIIYPWHFHMTECVVHRSSFESITSSINDLKLKQSHNTHIEVQGERRYNSYWFSTSALEGGEWSASRPGHVLAPEKDPRCPLYRRLGGPQNRSGHRNYRKNPFASAGDRTSIARSSNPQSDIILTELPGSHNKWYSTEISCSVVI
jgi:hypothetical protein